MVKTTFGSGCSMFKKHDVNSSMVKPSLFCLDLRLMLKLFKDCSANACGTHAQMHTYQYTVSYLYIYRKCETSVLTYPKRRSFGSSNFTVKPAGFETVLYEQGLVPSTKTHLLRFIPSLWGHWWKSKNMEQPESRSFGAKIGWCFSIQCIHNTLRRCIYLEAHILQLLVLTISENLQRDGNKQQRTTSCRLLVFFLWSILPFGRSKWFGRWDSEAPLTLVQPMHPENKRWPDRETGFWSFVHAISIGESPVFIEIHRFFHGNPQLSRASLEIGSQVLVP